MGDRYCHRLPAPSQSPASSPARSRHRRRREDVENEGSAQIKVTAEDIGHSLSQVLIVVIHQALGERQVVGGGSQKVHEPSEMCNVHD